ncbi:hypothetical protein E2C01_079832 [Portunus trituberculatus]|uniref:Uncharacterized protein n=1 Tax=Portunus trituberculatus TaxID=210409 RepID=A0A5B7IMI1_PORTR|nr:hypothetical protein [Portunus trituberculatus]
MNMETRHGTEGAFINSCLLRGGWFGCFLPLLGLSAPSRNPKLAPNPERHAKSRLVTSFLILRLPTSNLIPSLPFPSLPCPSCPGPSCSAPLFLSSSNVLKLKTDPLSIAHKSQFSRLFSTGVSSLRVYPSLASPRSVPPRPSATFPRCG